LFFQIIIKRIIMSGNELPKPDQSAFARGLLSNSVDSLHTCGGHIRKDGFQWLRCDLCGEQEPDMSGLLQGSPVKPLTRPPNAFLRMGNCTVRFNTEDEIDIILGTGSPASAVAVYEPFSVKRRVDTPDAPMKPKGEHRRDRDGGEPPVKKRLF
jgi:hypothetical protein